MVGLASSCLALLALGSSQIAPDHARNLTIYHVNPKSAGELPINMDTGDARGDLYFYLAEFLLPLECAADPMDYQSEFDCGNAELNDPTLVVTKVDLEVDERFGGYEACNLCSDGVDPLSQQPCEVGTYSCGQCQDFTGQGCDAAVVGVQDIAAFRGMSPDCGPALEEKCGFWQFNEKQCNACLSRHGAELFERGCGAVPMGSFCMKNTSNPCSEHSWTMFPWRRKARDFECWREKIPAKTGGYWYSTQREGLCNASSPVGSCSWRALSSSTVYEQCLKETLMTAVEAETPGCFESCGARNTTSHCWISCFFGALLGPEAHNTTAVAGMPIERIVAAWEKPFLPESEGGCPKVLGLGVGEAAVSFVV